MMWQVRVAALIVATFLVPGTVATAVADDAADPTGDWSWTFTRGDREIEILMTLKTDGEKLTGTVGREDRRREIQDGTFKDGNVAFKTVRQRDDRKFTMRFHGQLKDDAIEGKIEFEIRGETRDFPWKAKRVASLPVERQRAP